ncbi:WD40 repeat-like protein [Dichomitus squalens]|uniref:WD40 repeat-like protein n=1 Tax=Dichomitus squalens TaxID=114155 RepID=A0A4Q9Q726_9APHY|nr:WD40 repeat-like protein [Dichomitus squalens]TBU63175.1 WD40 repeat-like protein [Dichomitus squalens]
MSHQLLNATSKDEDEIPPPERPPSPPPHTTFAARGLHAPTFSAFRPRDIRLSHQQAMNHIAWSCDGRKLGAVGVDKTARVWAMERAVEMRSATTFPGGHSEDIDYIAWNPTHPELFCTSSQKDRRVVFWDGRQSRHVQQIQLKPSPVQLSYSPDGKTILYTTTNRYLGVLTFGKEGDEAKEQWRVADTNGKTIYGSTTTFNHAGDGLILTTQSDPAIRALDYPGLNLLHSIPGHVGGCVTTALDPRGRYLASGGNDSIVNLFDMSDWICARTITVCDNAINALSFSHDGEFIAIANAGNYIDICATETGMPLHRVPALGPAPSVAWHPSKHVIAYCGQTKIREGGPPPSAWISLFGPGM